MKHARLILLFFGLIFFSSTACKQEINSIVQIPIEWEYALSDQYEPLSFLADKEFKPLEEKQIHSLASLLKNENGYIWVRGYFDFKPSTDP